MLKENARLFALAQRAVDLLAVAVAFGAAFWLRFDAAGLPALGLVRPHPGPPPVEDYARALPIVLVVYLLALELAGLAEPRRTHGALREAFDAARASVGAFVVLLAAAELSRRYSRPAAAVFGVLATGLLSLERGCVRASLQALRRRGFNLRRALVVGEGELARELVRKLRGAPWTGIEVVGVLGLEATGPTATLPAAASAAPDEGAPPPPTPPAPSSASTLEGAPVLGSYRDLVAVARASGVDQVLLAVPLERAPLLRELRVLCDALPLDLSFVPDTAGFLPIRPTVSDLDGLPIVAIRRAPAAGPGAFAKRSLDLVGAALGLAVLAPVLVLIALAVKLREGGPVLYRQERVGWGGRPFVMLKFRTMVPDAELATGPTRTQRGDPRRTGLGSLLRRTSLDELPQLWNVLVGDMSLVGPRPERPEFLEDLRRELPDYMLRLTVKAGMTGLAQVNGLRGDSSLSERLRLDLDYVRSWSLALDLRILALTLVRGFVHENAF